MRIPYWKNIIGLNFRQTSFSSTRIFWLFLSKNNANFKRIYGPSLSFSFRVSFSSFCYFIIIIIFFFRLFLNWKKLFQNNVSISRNWKNDWKTKIDCARNAKNYRFLLRDDRLFSNNLRVCYQLEWLVQK